MIKPLDPLDLLRCTLLGEQEKSNRAYTLSSLGQETPSDFSPIEVSKAGLSLHGTACALVMRDGGSIIGIAAARQRSGPKSWEITHLLCSETDNRFSELLEKVAQTAASHGGERVFLRLLRDDPLEDVARLSGFFPSFAEVLYKGSARVQPTSNSFQTPLRKKAQRDEHDLFRLYNASTPSEVRSMVGMTFDQWTASREQARGKPAEFVLDRDGAIRGWVQTSRWSRVGHLAAMVHPDDSTSLASLVDFGAERLREADSIYCLAPEYQVSLQRILSERGLEAVAEYVTLVKHVAVRSKKEARANVTVAST
jgi:hypothetical protein